ncbi:hypothetical protein EJ08DRAFT_683940 [Tothia fuscella]|uniref:Uncharacterized protein n=1 Tax=Tothia fuscella TaxID=1048955 RepID=A0A9P4NF75_9PEZI|nr:hypothetical protein EJ08DRAFT_683940 [Tothia fuscella]
MAFKILVVAFAAFLHFTSASPTNMDTSITYSIEGSTSNPFPRFEKRLGVALDWCHDFQYRDCEANIPLDDRKCYALNTETFRGARGLSSVGFSGDMWCVLHTTLECHGDSVKIVDAQPDLRAVDGNASRNWDNKARAIKCHRNR